MARAPPSPDLSPEVDFGAFLRPGSRAGGSRPGNLPASQYSGFPASSAAPIVATSSQTKYGAQTRMRQGAPRLGGLGLGGLQTSPSPFPDPPVKKAAAPAVPKAPTPPPKLDPSPIERPFLSPEMVKPTVREGAFALDRPVPEVAASTTPPSDENVEETPERDLSSSEPSPFLGLSPSPPTTPSMDRLGILASQLDVDPNSLGGEDQGRVFQMMDEVLGMVEAELNTAERRVAEDSDSPEETSSVEASDEEELSDSQGDAEAEETEVMSEPEYRVDPGTTQGPTIEKTGRSLLAATLPAAIPFRSTSAAQLPPSPISNPRSASPVPSITSADSFHSADAEEEEATSEVVTVAPEADGGDVQVTPSTANEASASHSAAVPVVLVQDQSTRSTDEVIGTSEQTEAQDPRQGVEMARSPSSDYSDSSFSATPSSRRSTTSRGTSRSTSRTRMANPPPRPSRAFRPPSAHGASPLLASGAFPDSSPSTIDAPPSTDTQSPEGVQAAYSAHSSIPTSSQVGDSVFFVPPPPQLGNREVDAVPVASSAAPLPSLPSPPSPAAASTYEGLGLRLPSSIRPKGRRVSSQTSPPTSPSQATVPLVAPVFTSSASYTAPPAASPIPPPQSLPVPPPELGTAVEAANSSAPIPQAPTPVAEEPEKELAAAASTPHISRAPTPSPPRTPRPTTPVEKVEAKADDSAPAPDSGLADIGVAAVGAIATGGMAVGYMAWRGLSAAAGWGWGSSNSASAQEQAQEQSAVAVATEEVETESDSENVALPGGLKQSSLERITEPARTSEGQEDLQTTENNDEGESVVSTEWGDIAFPAPAGFLEAFKEAMAELGPEDLAANEKMEIDASEAAHDIAMQLARETFSPTTAHLTLRPPSTNTFPGRSSLVASKRASMSSLEPTRRRQLQREPGQEGDEEDELMELISPMLDSRIPERSPSLRYSAPPGLSPGGLTRSFSNSTQSSVSSRIPPPTSPNSALKASLKPKAEKSGGFFSFGSKRRSSNEARSPPMASSSASFISSNSRAMSVGSNSSDSGEQAKLKRKSSLFGGSSVKSSSPSPPSSTISSSIESQIVDTTYVSYSSGRSKRSSSNASSATSPPPAASSRLVASPGRRSSIRLETRYGSPESAVKTIKQKKIYTVRFANADRGIGLRSVAEDEAERAGGDRHAQRWVGVGRGDRYGNLIMETDAETDMMFAEQVGQIKKKWRFGGNTRDWTTVRID